MTYEEEIDRTIQLTDDETKILFSLSTEPEYDATFIRLLLDYLYKDDKSILTYRSFTGRTRKKNKAVGIDKDSDGSKFKAISPEKKGTIFSLFRKRIVSSGTTKHDKFLRLRSANITRLVGHGIGNIRLSKTPLNDIEKTDCHSHFASV